MASRPEPRRRLPLGRTRRRLGYERRLRILLALLGIPVFACVSLLMRRTAVSWPITVTTLVFTAVGWALVQAWVADQLLRPLQTLANVVAALRENDYSFRARGARRGDSLGDLALEINALANDLQRERVTSLESAALIKKILYVLQAPVLAFDERGLLRLHNPAGAALLPASYATTALGQPAGALGLGLLIVSGDEQVVSVAGKQWMVRRSRFRESGVPHELFLLSDVSAALREEERQAWQRLVRVLGHEINNSLTPIKSLASSLRRLVEQNAPTQEFERPLEIIEDRADSLNRFLTAYRQLAQLPPPRRHPLPLAPFLAQLAALETRVPVTLKQGPRATIFADRDQLSQALINLLRNAAEAALENGADPPKLQLGWRVDETQAVISLRDSGLGVANSSNLFVPFYTTKSAGTGVGLVLVKQIAEAHGGSVALRNHPEGGAEAELRIPLSAALPHAEPLPAG